MKPVSTGSVRKAVQVVFATGVAAGAVQAQAVDSWLRIPGIPGESVNADHKGEIDVISFTQTLDAKTCQLAVLKYLDSATPALSEATAKKSALPNVTLSARKSGDGQKDFLTITLLNASVASVDTSSAGGDVPPKEQVIFAPRSVTVTYRAQDAKGGLGAAVTSTFNCDK